MGDSMWWEELAVGRAFDLGSYAVTREEVIAFARKYDPQPFHIDDDAAAAHPVFGKLSASAVHTFAMTSAISFEGYSRHGIRPIAGGGVDAMRFEAPVFPGDTLTAEVAVIESRPLASRADRGLTRMRTIVRNQDGRTVMTYEGTIFFARRPDAEANVG